MAVRKFRGREVSSARPRGDKMVVKFKGGKDSVTVTKTEYDLELSLESTDSESKAGPPSSTRPHSNPDK